jgi:hypothetical protein
MTRRRLARRGSGGHRRKRSRTPRASVNDASPRARASRLAARVSCGLQRFFFDTVFVMRPLST